MKSLPKLKSAWKTIKLEVTISGDENGNIFDIHIQDLPYPFTSISYDSLPTLQEILEDFDK